MQEFSIDNLKLAYQTLKECNIDLKEMQSNSKMQEYIQDSCVKRFEYTLETALKLMKKYLKFQYGKSESELTINNIFRFMEGYGLISSFAKWSNYYAQRNSVAHEYNFSKVRKLLLIVDEFIEDVEFLINKFEIELGK